MRKQVLLAVLLAGMIMLQGCNIPGDHIIHKNKLQQKIDINLGGMFGINSQIGAGIQYNLQRINSPFRIGNPPGNCIDWMSWNVQNIKLGK
ncbi:MAG: hypothetical protein WBC22_02935 [Sedimentisphaerales bacterium]